MSGKSKIYRDAKGRDIARPFDPAILSEARRVAARYQIVLEQEDDWWYGHGLELPTTYGDGATPEAAVADTREGLVVTVAYLLEQDERPPAPASEGRRTEQVNIRLTAEERLHLEGRSQAQGFRGLSDYVRAAALAEAPAALSARTAAAARPRRRAAKRRRTSSAPRHRSGR